jgi:pimeloyl-ACP methyl ester carboxylesterase
MLAPFRRGGENQGVERGPIRYAKSGDINVAYQVTGDGPIDLVLVPGFVSHLELDWEHPDSAHFLDRLGSFSRLIRFDKRGTGLSDRPGGLPDLETRMDDVRAVMDAAGCERAALFGYSEGGPLSILFSATYPHRAQSLVIYGSYAKRFRTDDYPWAMTWEERLEYAERVERDWGKESDLHRMIPTTDEAMAQWWQKRARASASPRAGADLIRMNSAVDIREILPSVQAPILVLHREGDTDSHWEEGRYLAEHIPNARFIKLEGGVHVPWIDSDQILDEVEEFVTGVRPTRIEERVLSTVLFTDLVGSTEKARQLGDRAPGPSCSNATTRSSKTSWAGNRASRSIPQATGSSRCSTGRPGRFGARSPFTTRSAGWGWRCAPASTREKSNVHEAARRAGSRCTSALASWLPPARARCSSPRRRAISSRAPESSSRIAASSS